MLRSTPSWYSPGSGFFGCIPLLAPGHWFEALLVERHMFRVLDPPTNVHSSGGRLCLASRSDLLALEDHFPAAMFRGGDRLVCLFVCLPVCAISAVDLTMTAAAFRDLPQVLVASVEALQRSLKRA